MNTSNFRKIITLNDVVGTYSNEVSYMYQASNKALNSDGILFNSEMMKLENSSGEIINLLNVSGTRIQTVKNLYQFISDKFSIIELKQENSTPSIDLNNLKPFLFSKEKIELSFSYKGKVVKKISFPADSKMFHESLHFTIVNKSVMQFIFGKLDRIDFNEPITIGVKLCQENPLRSMLAPMFEEYHNRVIEGYFSKNFFRQDTITNEELKALTFRPRSYIALCSFIKNQFILPSNSSSRSLDVNIPREAIMEAMSLVEKIREKIFAIDEGTPI